MNNQTRVFQAVKIKMIHVQGTSLYIIGVGDFEARAGDVIVAAEAAGQATYQGGFAAAEITDKLNSLTAL